MKILYHIFTNGHDDWLSTEKEALQWAKEEVKKGNNAVRVYREEYSMTDYEEGTPTTEECIFSYGSFPY